MLPNENQSRLNTGLLKLLNNGYDVKLRSKWTKIHEISFQNKPNSIDIDEHDIMLIVYFYSINCILQ